MKQSLFIFFYFFLCNIIGFAQVHLHRDVLTIENGLPQNTVYDIIQDKKGFVYIATGEGVCRYDGFTTKRIKFGGTDNKGFYGLKITSLAINSKNIIYAGNSFGQIFQVIPGVNYFEQVFSEEFRLSNKITNDILQIQALDENIIYFLDERYFYSYNIDSGELIKLSFDQNLNPSDQLTKFLTDKNGNIYVFTKNKSVLKYSPDLAFLKSLNWFSYIDSADSFVDAKIDMQENFIIATTNVVYKINPISGSITSKKHLVKDLYCIEIDKSNNLWFGAADFSISKSENFFDSNIPIVNYTSGLIEKKLLASVRILKFINEGVLFIGTNGNGLSKIDYYPGRIGVIKNNPLNKKSLMNKSIRTIKPLNSNEIIVGGYNGLEKVDLKKMQFTRLIERREDEFGFPVYSSELDDNNRSIWIGTEGMGLKKFDLHSKVIRHFPVFKGFENNWITSLQNYQNLLLVGTANGMKIVNKITNSFVNGTQEILKETVSKHINSIFYDGKENIFVTTKNSGVLRFDKNLKLISSLAPAKFVGNNYAANDIKSIVICKNDKIWMGTNGAGLIVTDSTFETVKQFTSEDGLPNNTIYGVLADSLGNLWMSTNYGISQYVISENRFHNIVDNNLLQSREFNTNAFSIHNGNDIYFGGIQGINYINSGNYNKNINQYKISFEEIYSENITYDLEVNSSQNNLEFSNDTKEINIRYNLIAYLSDVPVHFSYKLEGFDEDWKDIQNKFLVTFQNLPAGDYKLLLKHIVSKKQIASLNFSIIPPFYLSTGFIILSSFIFIGIGPLIYFIKTNKLLKEKKISEKFAQQLIESKEKEGKRIAYNLHDSVAQQMMLLKMNISRLKNLVVDDKSEELFADLQSQSSLILDEIRNISHSMHPHHLDKIGLNKSIESLIRRFEKISGIEFKFVPYDDKSINFGKLVDLNLYRIVQEAVSNIIKHSKASKAVLEFNNDNNEISFIISDNGVGFSKANKRDGDDNLGILSIYERCRIINASVNYYSIVGRGTKLVIKFRNIGEV